MLWLCLCISLIKAREVQVGGRMMGRELYCVCVTVVHLSMHCTQQSDIKFTKMGGYGEVGRRWVAKLHGDGWLSCYGDGWISCYGDGWLNWYIARLLATAALWDRSQTSLKNSINRRHKQRSGQQTIDRPPKKYTKKVYLQWEIQSDLFCFTPPILCSVL
jgi:hypothetical protein